MKNQPRCDQYQNYQEQSFEKHVVSSEIVDGGFVNGIAFATGEVLKTLLSCSFSSFVLTLYTQPSVSGSTIVVKTGEKYSVVSENCSTPTLISENIETDINFEDFIQNSNYYCLNIACEEEKIYRIGIGCVGCPNKIANMLENSDPNNKIQVLSTNLHGKLKHTLYCPTTHKYIDGLCFEKNGSTPISNIVHYTSDIQFFGDLVQNEKFCTKSCGQKTIMTETNKIAFLNNQGCQTHDHPEFTCVLEEKNILQAQVRRLKIQEFAEIKGNIIVYKSKGKTKYSIPKKLIKNNTIVLSSENKYSSRNRFLQNISNSEGKMIIIEQNNSVSFIFPEQYKITKDENGVFHIQPYFCLSTLAKNNVLDIINTLTRFGKSVIVGNRVFYNRQISVQEIANSLSISLKHNRWNYPTLYPNTPYVEVKSESTSAKSSYQIISGCSVIGSIVVPNNQISTQDLINVGKGLIIGATLKTLTPYLPDLYSEYVVTTVAVVGTVQIINQFNQCYTAVRGKTQKTNLFNTVRNCIFSATSKIKSEVKHVYEYLTSDNLTI